MCLIGHATIVAHAVTQAVYGKLARLFLSPPIKRKSLARETMQGGVTSMPPVVPFAFTIKILDDQEITNNCRRAQIYNDIHIITRKYTDVYRENGCFDRRKLALIP